MVDDPLLCLIATKVIGDAVHSECRLVYALVCWLLLEEAADSAACTPKLQTLLHALPAFSCVIVSCEGDYVCCLSGS